MMHKHAICIAEDHAIVREGLRAILATYPQFEVVAEAADGFDLMTCLQEHRADLVLMDLSMPRLRGLEAIREINKRYPDTKILVLTMHEAEEYVLAALQAGAQGYLLKDSAQTELTFAINAVLAGRVYLTPAVSALVVGGYLEAHELSKIRSSSAMLTHRERQILKLIAEGFRNKKIATQLHVSVKTVETHRSNLLKKLGFHCAAELTAYAIANGLVSNQ